MIKNLSKKSFKLIRKKRKKIISYNNMRKFQLYMENEIKAKYFLIKKLLKLDKKN